MHILYVCVYIYIHIYIHTHTYTYSICTYCMCMCVCVCVCIYIYIYTHTHTKSKSKLLSHRKHNFSITNTKQLMFFTEIITVYSENHTKHTNTVFGQGKYFLNIKGGI